MPNPYEAPVYSASPSASSALSDVRAPAIALLVVALFAIVIGLFGLAVDLFLVASGTVERLEELNDGPVSEQTQLMVRSVWGIVLVLASSFVVYGALKMLRMKHYGAAKAAAIVAMIPLLGPCCVLGIPFGIWAFIVLGKPHVKAAFAASGEATAR